MIATRTGAVYGCVNRFCSFLSSPMPCSFTCTVSCCTKPTELDQTKVENDKGISEVPEAPVGMCCGTGCPNCVWVKYADQLIAHYKEKGLDKALLEIDKSLDDEALKIFIKLDIKLRYGKG